MDYIPINSIKDIDIRKISIRDINKRYIDREGNRFATRFNMEKRRVEIVRLARNRTEAQKLRGEILRGKREAYLGRKPDGASYEEDPHDSMNDASDLGPAPDFNESEAGSTSTSGGRPDRADPAGSSTPENSVDDLDEGLDFTEEAAASPDQPAAAETAEIDEDTMLEQQFLEEASIHIGRMKDRQISILNALKNLQGTLIETQEISEVQREIDMNCWQKSDEAINYYKELYGYPRSISHYMVRLHPDLKNRVNDLPADEDRMTLIKRNESVRIMEETYYNFYNMTDRLNKIFQNVTPEILKELPMTLSRQVEDAITSCEMLMRDIRAKQAEFKVWRRKYC